MLRHGGDINIFSGDKSGGFSKSNTFSNVFFSIANFQIADVNNDGIKDIIYSDYGQGIIGVIKGNGKGNFSSAVTFSDGGGSTRPLSIVAGDFNGDGSIDFAVGHEAISNVSIFINDGNGNYNSRSLISVSGVSIITAGDINGDGITDILSANSGSVSSFIGNADSSGRRNNLTSGIDLTNIISARAALDKTGKLLEKLGVELGSIGATQARFASSLRNLQILTENYAAARSRILDVDVAEESSQLIQKQIRQNAAAAVLQQANQEPKLALLLLQQ